MTADLSRRQQDAIFKVLQGKTRTNLNSISSKASFKIEGKKKKRHFQMKTEIASAANQTKNSTKVSSSG